MVDHACLCWFLVLQNHVAGASAIKGWHIPLANYTLDRMVWGPDA